MATEAASGGQGGPAHENGGKVRFAPIMFRTLSWMGVLALAWTFASALGPPGSSGPKPAPKAQSMLNRLR